MRERERNEKKSYLSNSIQYICRKNKIIYKIKLNITKNPCNKSNWKKESH